ncbi:hypothetical protein K431DRAFT_307019 [Polychaeton citri CBS 116435]|uniref:ARM repeat-containing protein n=1 Tax=Polychaeton citri CBS 116435 TaxID=1314669 RepID=A0A9P4Q071_9PEZI|nr:hypothetical protein K431DRAFT_307019 [Polychaeton citri CBS 116435]
MAPGSRPDYKLNLEGLPQLNMGTPRSANGSNANSPIDTPAGSGLRYPLGNGGSSSAGAGRAGAGSPSKDFGGSRLFPKRAREIQAQEGLSPSIWGPPTASGHSTPLRETIPESPGSDSFPDFNAETATTGFAPSSATASHSARRTRAGTVPSRFPPVSSLNNSQPTMPPKSGRQTPSSSPYNSSTPPHAEQQAAGGATFGSSALLSRLRAGSMPQRSNQVASSGPFGSSVFASNWLAGRDRAGTLQSIRSSDAPSSPRESPADNDVRTLDYLGLVDSPQYGKGSVSREELEAMMRQRQQVPSIADMAAMNSFKNTANRFRSFSVNAKEKYNDAEDDDMDQYSQMLYSGHLTPSAETAAAQAAAIQEAVRQHNLEVQAFANFASANRPRARTAGVLDSPSSRVLKSYMPTPSRLGDSSLTAADLQSNDGSEYGNLAAAVQNMSIGANAPYETGLEGSLETPTRSLWLGNIPSSTTVSSLNVFFGQFGPIEFARVLTHKSCGFVNFESLASAVTAKAQCNGKEIFPGCGPIRIGFAKEQSASNTPGANGAYPSPSPDPFVSKASKIASTGNNINAETAAAALVTPDITEHIDELLDIVQQFGAAPEEQARIAANLENALKYNEYKPEIPPIPEPSHNRIHDAPRLRDIRKRIDNSSISPVEVESIALEMLPEIAELASDYLGNTVVQKLFETCTEDTKEAMLTQITPHLAEIGVHKNGTWAAQKIIDVARTPRQMNMIVDALRAHSVNLFLDQYGNYVMQCCLRFQAPINDFIFDAMINKLWPLSQGRFGARAMRACLESHFATNDQKRLMAAAIALHSVQLATNSNGALLLTWFLDTCTLPKRRSVLAPKLIPHIVHLCTHKVAYLTVLKIINQRNEPQARDSILRALFFDERTLTDIISDQACGATFIFKVLTTPFLDDSLRPECMENVRNTLLKLKAQPSQGYKRLMDEVGLSTRHGGTPVGNEARSSSKNRGLNGQLPNLDTNPNGYGRGYAGMTPQHHAIGADLSRAMSIDSNGFDAYGNGLVTPQYSHSPSMSNAGMSPVNPQLQYQQAMLAQQSAQIQQRPPGFYNSPAAAGPQMGGDPFRQNMNGSPMVQGMQGGFQTPPSASPYGGPPMMGGMGQGYGQYIGMQQYYPQQGQMQQGQQGSQGGGGRRGRVSSLHEPLREST